MWVKAPNTPLLPKASIPATWRQIETALSDYFAGTYYDGDLFVDLEGNPDWDNDCDDCSDHYAEINLTDLARYLADELGGAP
jgi:hypothetical protein